MGGNMGPFTCPKISHSPFDLCLLYAGSAGAGVGSSSIDERLRRISDQATVRLWLSSFFQLWLWLWCNQLSTSVFYLDNGDDEDENDYFIYRCLSRSLEQMMLPIQILLSFPMPATAFNGHTCGIFLRHNATLRRWYCNVQNQAETEKRKEQDNVCG